MLNIKERINKELTHQFGNNSHLIQELISPAVGIKLKDKSIDSLHKNSTPLLSKIGGFPDIEANFVWPSIDSSPLTFLCQIDLEKVSNLHPGLQLDGVLYFFISNEQALTYDKAESSFRVIYQEKSPIKNKLSNDHLPVLDEHLIEFYEHYTLPSYQERIINDNHYYSSISDDLMELSQYISALTFGTDDFTNHHFFGDPDAVQGDVRMFWGAKILKPADIFYEGLADYFQSAQEIGDDFILLLQLDLLDQRIQLYPYGDNCLYFGILKEDLKNKNFANVKLVIQST